MTIISRRDLASDGLTRALAGWLDQSLAWATTEAPHGLPSRPELRAIARGIISAFLVEPQFTMTDTLRSMLGDQADAVGQGQQARDPIETVDTVTWLASYPDALRHAGPDIINAPNFLQSHGYAPLGT